MKLSKEIRELIFRTPKIMRKFKITYSYHSPCPLMFFGDRGASIRRLKLNIKPEDEILLRFLLNCTPNLEELELFKCENYTIYTWTSSAENRLADLSKLKSLDMQADQLDYFIKNTKNVKNLKNLTIYRKYQKQSELLKDFLDQQNHKRELNVILSTCNWNINGKFLEAVAEHVTEVVNNFRISDQSLSMIFGSFKKLRKFTDVSQRSTIITEQLTLRNLQSKSLKIYENRSETFKNSNFEIITKKFPNLETLVCHRFQVTEGSNNSLQTLHVCGMSFDSCRNFKLPNLKNFRVDFSTGLTQYLFWTKFYKNIENVENIEITGYMRELIDENLAQNLDKFKKLKSFKFTSIRIGSECDIIFVDKSSKMVDVSKDLELKYLINFGAIWEKFEGFKIFKNNSELKIFQEMACFF